MIQNSMVVVGAILQHHSCHNTVLARASTVAIYSYCINLDSKTSWEAV